jgi:hypothetical protein
MPHYAGRPRRPTDKWPCWRHALHCSGGLAVPATSPMTGAGQHRGHTGCRFPPRMRMRMRMGRGPVRRRRGIEGSIHLANLEPALWTASTVRSLARSLVLRRLTRPADQGAPAPPPRTLAAHPLHPHPARCRPHAREPAHLSDAYRWLGLTAPSAQSATSAESKGTASSRNRSAATDARESTSRRASTPRLGPRNPTPLPTSSPTPTKAGKNERWR